ncbi:hypothetical protein FB45DRAFT_509878 [Roridomyces roridus]|uniref:Uncharacterized protein n=1 Tax=Roridomyces roridus TaxID=1738132 RepID=A0AAD7FPY3_9AGAR|nr:hypothetical protein FB45DRAFT_509878 [Roridomyces roridus]
MTSVLKVPKTSSENSESLVSRRKSTKRILSSDEEDDAPAISSPPLKKSRIDGSPESSVNDPPSPGPGVASKSRLSKTRPSAKSSQKRSKMVESDPESEEFDPVDDDSELEPPMEEDDDDEYMSEPKNPTKRGAGMKGKGGGKGKNKVETKEIMARDERKRPAESVDAAAPAAKRARTRPPGKTADELIIDIVGDGSSAADTPTPKDESAPTPKKSKLPPIKKNKAATSGPSTGTGASNPPKPAPPRTEEESKLPVIPVTRKQTIQSSVDVDLSNPAMYAQLFKPGGGNTPSGRHPKEDERRKELNRMRDEARAKRSSEAAAAFDLQGQMDKISRFEERLRLSKSYSVYPNYLGGALKTFPLGNSSYSSTDAGSDVREEGEM